MANAKYSSLSLDIKSDNKDALKGINDLRASLESFKEASAGIRSTKFTGLKKSIQAINDCMNELSSINVDTSKVDSITNSISKLADASRAINRLGKVEKFDFSNMKSNLDSFMSMFDGIDDSQSDKILKVAAAASAMNKIGNQNKQQQSVDNANGSADSTSKLSKLQSLLSGVKDGAKTAAQALVKVGSAIGNSFKEKISNATKKVKDFVSSIGRIMMYRAIRSVLKNITEGFTEGMQNAYMWANLTGNQFANSMDQIATSTTYAKNAIGAMAAPLYNAVAPVIDALVDKFVALVNVINQFFSAFGGSGKWIKAIKAPQSYADSISGTGNAAKKAKKEIDLYLASFDELNVIPKKNDSSSGSGGSSGGKDYSGMFEEADVDSGISDFVNQMKDAIDRSDWKGLGQLLGNKVNSIVDSIDYTGIGAKVGQGINGAIQTVYWFLDTVNFTNIGSHIAEFLNSAIANIDFTYLGRLLVKGMTIPFDMLIGFLDTLDYNTIANALKQFINGGWQEAVSWFSKYNWVDEIGTIASGISNVFITACDTATENIQNIDWVSVGETIGDCFIEAIEDIDPLGIVDALLRLAASVSVAIILSVAGMIKSGIQELWNNLVDAWNEAMDESDGNWLEAGANIIGGLLQGLLDGILGIGEWIGENIVQPLIDGFCELLGIHSPSTVFEEYGGYIIEGLLNGLKGAFQDVIDFVTNFADNIKQSFSDTWDNIKQKASDKWNTIKNNLNDAWTNIKDKASDKFSNIKQKISDSWTDVSSKTDTKWQNIKSSLNSSFDTIKTNASNAFDNIKTKTSNKWDEIKSSMTDPIQKAKDKIKEIVDKIKGFFNFNISWPHIAMPHFGITPRGWSVGDLLKGKIPKLSIDWYASGGFPDAGQLFIAREAGAEMVGNVCGRTAVANNDQIVEAVSNGVYRAVTSAMSGGSNSENINMNVYLDGEVVYKNVVKHNNQKVKQTGESPLIV